jgi:formate hydrogenlyase subunit 3/multisubunit Na+/H+ antiporter MnhD subunit
MVLAALGASGQPLAKAMLAYSTVGMSGLWLLMLELADHASLWAGFGFYLCSLALLWPMLADPFLLAAADWHRAAVLAVLSASLSDLPPLVGFMGKAAMVGLVIIATLWCLWSTGASSPELPCFGASALFVLVGQLFDRYHTEFLVYLASRGSLMPVWRTFSCCWLWLTLACLLLFVASGYFPCFLHLKPRFTRPVNSGLDVPRVDISLLFASQAAIYQTQ